jgi:hypothetical protein
MVSKKKTSRPHAARSRLTRVLNAPLGQRSYFQRPFGRKSIGGIATYWSNAIAQRKA